ncbi:hypothetical protein CUR178_08081 [Leishmania enriettii]|uniref:Uncharacterized protein n=1 Tax=Leishmania enriettii TaxID=5663 RepID=A0A836HYC3_LEIEN|nr:hypothetical protein CUR178_08081 [Leishmania enriettii]
MPSSRKRVHAVAEQAPHKPVKQQRGQQVRPSSPGQAAGKSSSASTSASAVATALAAPQLLKPRRSLRSVTLNSVESFHLLPKASAAASWRAQLLRLATQEAHTAATLLRLLPSSAPPSVRDDAQPSRSPLGTATPQPASSGAGATGGAEAQAGQAARRARGHARHPLPQVALTGTVEAPSPPTQTVQWTSYAELWEGLLARLPCASGDDAGGSKRRRGKPAVEQRDSAAPLPAELPGGEAKDAIACAPAAHLSVMRCALNNDWRSFFLSRVLSASAASSVRNATLAPGREVAAWAQRCQLEDLVCPPYMTHAEQRAVRRYATASIAADPSGVQRGLSSVCALDFV